MKKYYLFSVLFLLISFSKAQLPVAGFIVADSTVCPGTCTNFTNLSTNATSYHWTFTGGSPSTSTVSNPQNICYNAPGNYSVTLIASNSTGSDTLTIINCVNVYPYPPPLGLMNHGDTLFVAQGLFIHYQWYLNFVMIPGDTLYWHVAMPDGVHSPVATDSNGCEVEPVTFGPLFIPDFIPGDTEFCASTCIDFNNITQWLSGDSAYATHQWYFNGATPSLSQDYSPQNICYNNAGTYLVKYVVLAEIVSRSDSFMLNVLPCTGVLENSFQQISLSPNPFCSDLNLHFVLPQGENAFLKIMNTIGETVVEKQIKLEDHSLNLSELPEGIYFLSIQNENGIFTKKILKKY
jgi:hypothetical protein